MDMDKLYTQDGSVDLYGRPVLADKTGKWKACCFLLVYEIFERLAFYGVSANLVMYLTNVLHEDTVTSVRTVSTWSGVVWITPILGAYIADTYLGRFWTFTIASIITLLGMVLLFVGVLFKDKLFVSTCTFVNESICPTPKGEIVFFYVALYIMALGAGGTKPNISTLGADQFDDYNSYEHTLKCSFFNWWFFGSFVGALLSTITVYLQDKSNWVVGWGIPTIGLFVSLVVFYAGTPFYRHKQMKAQSPISEIFEVFKKAFVNRKVSYESPATLYELEPKEYSAIAKRQLLHTSCFKFLDKAASKQSSKPCTITQVEASKLFLRMFLVWLTALIPYTLLAQTNTLFIKQGSTLDRSMGPHFQVPAAALGSIIVVSICVGVPLYDKLFVPFIRRRTKNPRGIAMLERIGIGFALIVVDIIVAYFTERKRMDIIQRNGLTSKDEMVPMSIFWLLPQYILVGISDVFSAIGLLEFFYDQSPESMQSLGATFFTSGYGIGNFLNSVFVTVVDELTRRYGGKSWIGDNLNDSRLDYYYAFLIVLSALNLVAFLWGTRQYQYKREVEGIGEDKYVQLEELLCSDSC